MRDTLLNALSPDGRATLDPVELTQKHIRRPLPKRFYKTASLGTLPDGFNILLDGRPARTPGKAILLLPSHAAGAGLVAEWQAAGEHIDPAKMPMTRIANSAIDGVAREMPAVAAEIVKYASSDLICYRASEPAALVAAQAAAWDPVLTYARDTLHAPLLLAQGVIFVAQPSAASAAIARVVQSFDTPLKLACLHVMTTLLGSALLAVGVAHGRLNTKAAWAAAHVDEDFQAATWGPDHEASVRRALRWQDFAAAAQLLRSVSE